MAIQYLIEDEVHAAQVSTHNTLAEALAELERLASIPWNEQPNVAPCTNWKACGRRYEILEYETSTTPWTELRRIPVLEVKAQGIVWDDELPR